MERAFPKLKYRIYIDEVGNPDLDSSENPNHRFLSLTGVIAELRHVADVIHPEMEALKSKYFRSHPDDPVIFHRAEMVNAKPPFEALKDPQTVEAFDRDLLDHLSRWEYAVVSVCLDKKKHKDTYKVWRFDPYHYCLTVLLERFVFFLDREGAVGDAMSESRGGKEDIRLKRSFETLMDRGTDFLEPQRFASVFTSRQLKVKLKANNVAGLQVADLIAHPSRNEILYQEGLIKPPAPFAQKVIALLQSKYYQDKGRVYGKKFI